MKKAEGTRWTSLERKDEPVYAKLPDQGQKIIYNMHIFDMIIIVCLDKVFSSGTGQLIKMVFVKWNSGR